MDTSIVVRASSAIALLMGCGSSPVNKDAVPDAAPHEASLPEAAARDASLHDAGHASPRPPDAASKDASQSPEAKTAAWYATCIDHYNTRDWAKLSTCYSSAVVQQEPDTGSPPWVGVSAAVGHLQSFVTSFPDSSIEPQLTLVNGTHIVGIALLRGTNTGPLPGDPTATNKPVGFLIAHSVELDEGGLITSEWIVYDHATLYGQLGLGAPPPRALISQGVSVAPVVLATGDKSEANNLAVYQKTLTAFNAHSPGGFSASLEASLVWSELSLPMDLTLSGLLARTAAWWGGFSDLQRTASNSWSAGDYVVGTGKLTGTNNGMLVSLGLNDTGQEVSVTYVEVVHLTAGKWDRSWLVYDGQAVASQLGVPALE